VKLISGTQDKGLAAEMDAFVEAAKGTRAIDFAEIEEVTRATFAIVESLRTARPVEMPR
jgi:hypothetical protein